MRTLLRPCFCLLSLLLCCSAVAGKGSTPRRTKWKTLTGDPPLVIARGGFSGIFPDSSTYAYQFALQTGSSNLHLWCDVQLTKDGAGICFPDIRLENASDIDQVYPNRKNTYIVNGVSTLGWFSMDFSLDDLSSVKLKQRIFSRAPNFDGTPMQILTPDKIVGLKPPGLWLNIQRAEIYTQHNLSMRNFVISTSRRMIINYISSPEIGFLRSIGSRFRKGPTKLVFQFLGPDDVEPSTNQTYSSLMTNFTFIKTFAAGILVPKTYIWPVGSSLYLMNHTSLVTNAHSSGLEVFASNFVNDDAFPYDYSSDPVAEYLSYIDNGQFSVDGVLSDFPPTPSAAVDCFSHMGKNAPILAKVLVLSSEGASGDYPGCTDKAYAKAVSDGAEVLNCPVQVASDGMPFCLGSINLRDNTNVAETSFGNRAVSDPDLNIKDGVYTYNLTWSEVQTLKPAISNPFARYDLFRNPRAKNDGKLLSLLDFLSFANSSSSVSGVLISIENAAFLAKKQGIGVIEMVSTALDKAGYNNQSAKRIMIKSKDSAVLTEFKSSGRNYELVYEVPGDYRDVLNVTVSDIKEFATSAVISKKSVFPAHTDFLIGQTDIVQKLKNFNLSVYVQLFQNEFVSQPWDFFSDPYMEISTHVYIGIDGVITEYPATAAKFKRNRCLGYTDVPMYMSPVQPGGLLVLMAQNFLPPAEAPKPVLTEEDVLESPLPAVGKKPSLLINGTGPASPAQTSPKNEQPMLVVASTVISIVSIICSVVLF